MKPTLQKLLIIGLVAEALIFIGSYIMYPEWEETFRYAARYSGRLSAMVFLMAFYGFAMAFPKPLKENSWVRNLIRLFAIVHIIHFGFLAMNIYLNNIALVPVKLTGGALAYLMIVSAPFVLHRLIKPLQMVYFYYVTVVMIVTYLSRAKGDFEGGEPFWFHYFALGVLIASALIFGILMFKNRKRTF